MIQVLLTMMAMHWLVSITVASSACCRSEVPKTGIDTCFNMTDREACESHILFCQWREDLECSSDDTHSVRSRVSPSDAMRTRRTVNESRPDPVDQHRKLLFFEHAVNQ